MSEKLKPEAVPLHPEIVAFIDQIKNYPAINTLSPEENRRNNKEIVAYGEKEEVGVIQDRTISGPNGEIPIRIYHPAGQVRGIIVYFHGGGWVVGDLDTADLGVRLLVNRTECTIVSVDYRLAPEHPFPEGLEDCYASLLWAATHRVELTGCNTPLLIAGESAGGNLAAAVAILARDRSGPEIALQILLYPATDADFETTSYIEQATGGLLGAEDMRWYWEQYVSDPQQRLAPLASPLRLHSMAGLAPALIQTAYHDPLRDEGRAYADRLKRENVPVTHTEYQLLSHGYLNVIGMLPSGMRPIEDLGNIVRERFSAHTGSK